MTTNANNTSRFATLDLDDGELPDDAKTQPEIEPSLRFDLDLDDDRTTDLASGPGAVREDDDGSFNILRDYGVVEITNAENDASEAQQKSRACGWM